MTPHPGLSERAGDSWSPGVRFAAASLASVFLTWSVPAAAGDWMITPRITAQEIYTDNVLLTPTNRRSDFITTVAPGLSISGESPRLQAKLDYAPTVHFTL